MGSGFRFDSEDLGVVGDDILRAFVLREGVSMHD